MKNTRFDSLQLLVLIPHRDSRNLLRAFSASLFSGGLSGAWSFPWVMPIAALSRPLSGTQLKSRALMLRKTMELSGGKITTGRPDIAALPSDFNNDAVSVFGPTVNIGLSDSFFAFEDNAIIRRISPLVIGVALQQAASLPTCPTPSLSFRAAALANMSFRPLPSGGGAHDNFSFEWETGKLYWLPRVKEH
jgi:hypothetical protein